MMKLAGVQATWQRELSILDKESDYSNANQIQKIRNSSIYLGKICSEILSQNLASV